MTGTVVFSLIAVIVAFILFVVLCLKGLNPIFVALLCTVLVCLSTPNGISSVFTTFMPGVASQFQNFFLVFAIGGAYGYALMDSGASTAVSRHLIKVFGTRNVPIIIFVITTLFAIAGVSSYQFAVFALSIPLLKESNLPKKVAVAAMSAGAGSIAYGTLVGVPNILNIAPTTYLGTTTMAAVGMSLTCTCVSLVFIYLWLNYERKKCLRNGIGFDGDEADIQYADTEAEKLPPAWKGYLSLLMVAIISIVLQFVFHVTALWSVVYAQVISIVVLILLVGKKHLEHPLTSCMKGFIGSLPAVITICIIVGYASCVQSTEAFQAAVKWVLGLNMHPYIICFIGVNLISAMCAHGMAGINVFMSAVGTQLAQNPIVNVNAFHRIASISAAGLDSLPHNGQIAFQLSVFKLSYKDGYFQQFMMSVVVNLLAGIVAVVIGILFY